MPSIKHETSIKENDYSITYDPPMYWNYFFLSVLTVPLTSPVLVKDLKTSSLNKTSCL